MILDLTIAEVIDLAEGCGLEVDKSKIPECDMETVVCIANCHKGGVENDDGVAEHFNYVMYFESCPEEGVFTLGEPIKQESTTTQEIPLFEGTNEALNKLRV